VDAQAIGRVFRYGQLRETFIYRLMMTGSIEEKVFQRQV
jgi:SNF2 family DNA or RNA helicase